jgi:hypothetical protein
MAMVVAIGLGWAPAAFACGGLVAPNGAVKLVNTTTLVAYHDGVEHYVTSFEYEGGGTKFGSIIPLPGVPTAVSRGGSWTLQRLEREVHPPAPDTFDQALAATSAAASPAQVLLHTQIDALQITVIKGGGPAVTTWVRQQGFTVSPGLPAMLNYYAQRSPIFLTATFDPAAEAARGQTIGDGTPVQITIPTANPWVPLHILSLAKDPDDVVTADVFMLTDRQPAVLSGPGVHLVQSRPAQASLLNDLRSDKGMGWIAPSAWLSYLTVDAPADSLNYDLAADVSGADHPSPVAAAITPTTPHALLTLAPISASAAHAGGAATPSTWKIAVSATYAAMILLAGGALLFRRRTQRT